jgi:hypothetical protein
MSTQKLNNNIMVSTSPFMMTINEYFTKIFRTDTNLENGWGWFVDIELNSEPIRVVKKTFNKYNIYNGYNKYNRYMSIPKTIKEYPSIRSMKSTRNLHDTSMLFNMEEDNNEKSNSNKYASLYTNLMGVLILGFCFYIVNYN